MENLKRFYLITLSVIIALIISVPMILNINFEKYDIQYNCNLENQDKMDFFVEVVMEYDRYKAFCERYGYNKMYNDASKNYIVYTNLKSESEKITDVELLDINYEDEIMYLRIEHKSDISSDKEIITNYMIVIPTDKKIKEVRTNNGIHTLEVIER